MILLCAFGTAGVQEPQAVLLRERKITALFGVLVFHIRAGLFAHKRAETRPELIAVHRTMRASFKSRVSPEIFVGVCGKVSGFLGFREFVLSRLICTPLQGRANPSHNRANASPESMPMVNPTACAHAR